MGVLAGALAEQRLAGWVPDDIARQVGDGHRHTWVRPAQAQARLSDGGAAAAAAAAWYGICRECLCRLDVAGAEAGGGCVDAVGHHFHATLSTAAETGSGAAGPQAACRGAVRCCRCAMEVLAWLQLPVVEPEAAGALAGARQQGHAHHPVQGARDLLETVTTLFRLVKNACIGDTRGVKVDSPAPRRLLRFDAPCNQLLEILGFARAADGSEFCPPEI
ncbi:hypothetical protein IWQ57_004999, partial [Coemansia nantahalensis]